MKVATTLLVTVAGCLAVASSALAGERQYSKAVMLDAADFDFCHGDCAPFDRPTLYFCLQSGNQLFIGSRGADWFWQYNSYKMFDFRGKEVRFRHDGRSMWVVRTDGKEMHLTADYSRDVFMHPECSAEVHRHWLGELGGIRRPATVPTDAVVVAQGSDSPSRRRNPHFWIACKYEKGALWDVCQTWDEKGRPLTRLECVDSSTHRAVPQKDLTVDQLQTTKYHEIYLQNGVVLRDWAKARINDDPTPDSTLPKPPIDQPQERE